jgi:hypothetical protein
MLFMQMFSKLQTGVDGLSEQVVRGMARMQLQPRRTYMPSSWSEMAQQAYQ